MSYEEREIEEPTVQVLVFLAGDMADVRRACREFCMEGLCVSVERTDFIYTCGAEEGALVRVVNYPRFPSTEGEFYLKAKQLARHLRVACHQSSVLVVGPHRTAWITTRPE